MGSWVGELGARQAAVRSRVAELEEEVAALTARLEAEREWLARLMVTRETLAELAAEGIAIDAAAVAPPSAEPMGGGQAVEGADGARVVGGDDQCGSAAGLPRRRRCGRRPSCAVASQADRALGRAGGG